jgi:hypothetical protein
MSLFGKILEKLGLRKDQDDDQATTGTAGTAGQMPRKPSATSTNPKATTAGKPTGTAPTSRTGVSATTSVADKRQQDDVAVKHTPAAAPARPTTAAPKAMSEVDVKAMLEQKAKGTGLNWKQSISDLLSLLDNDNSYDARVELAKELNAPPEVMGDSARMNTWLHKEVQRKIAENGGNVPQELLD